VKISVIAVGKTHSDYQELVKNYLSRISRDINIDLFCIKECGLKKEEELLNKKVLGKKSFIVCLDSRGKCYNSESFSDFIRLKREDRLLSEIFFIIAGAYGFSSSFLKNADVILSLSEMTFTHQMVRIILFEQIYRAFEIIRGSSYHK